jgi:hypothetical protein
MFPTRNYIFCSLFSIVCRSLYNSTLEIILTSALVFVYKFPEGNISAEELCIFPKGNINSCH